MTDAGRLSVRERAIGGLADEDGAVGAAREHALVDQATGWLAGRLDCTMTEASGHLVTLAVQTGVPVPEAAALLLGDGLAPAGRTAGKAYPGDTSVPPQADGRAPSETTTGGAFPGDTSGPPSAIPGDSPGRPVVPRQRARQRRFRSGLAMARGKIEFERREATLRMQQAILPARDHQVSCAGYDIAVQYQPAQSGTRVGGDWYEARARGDGGALMAIGDVAGHGLAAAAGMARTGNALRGMTITGEPPDTLLRWLNDLVCADESPEQVASAAVGVLDAGPPRLRWAQAGHPPPVLVRDAEPPRMLARPSGLLLGSLPGSDYELAAEDLACGDRVIFYTDGLIERRSRDIDEGLAELLRTAECCRGTTAVRGAGELAARLSPGAEDDICVLVVAVSL